MALKLRPSTILPFLQPRPLPKLTPLLQQTRHASHAEQSRANGPRQGPGKRLGAKKSSQQYVVPGNIIFRQRGTHWFPGENCGMGRDHTIFAKERGYVVFYRDPDHLSLGVGGPGYGGCFLGSGERRGSGVGVVGKRKIREGRRYIGVVERRGEMLPRGRGVVRKRRLGLEAREMSTLSSASSPSPYPSDESPDVATSDKVPNIIAADNGAPVVRDSTKETRRQVPEARARGIRPGYMYREANWQIGRVESEEMKSVRPYVKGDRFLAWRKKTRRLEVAAEKRTLRGQGKKKTGGR